jgi:hypothetical protein
LSQKKIRIQNIAETPKPIPAKPLAWKIPREIKIAIAGKFRANGDMSAKDIFELLDTHRVAKEDVPHLLGYIDRIRHNNSLKRLTK